MHFELFPQQFQHGLLPKAFSYGPYNCEIPISLPYDLIRLYQEKNILSKGLADCVIYLKALREKQASNARRLNMELPLSRKKRKCLQQTERRLDSEIKNRERDEQAFLNNLQACETSIFLANLKAYHSANASYCASGSASIPALYTPTLCSYSESETTDLTWNGWTDEAVVLPFQKKSNNPYFIDDLAPDACTEDLKRGSAITEDARRPAQLSLDKVELSNSLPMPPNTAQLQSRWSSVLSPEAAVFQPTYSTLVQQDDCHKSNLKQLGMSSSIANNAVELLQKRRFSAAEIVPNLQCSSINARFPHKHLPGQMWCKTTPQLNPQKDAEVQMSRRRNNSL